MLDLVAIEQHELARIDGGEQGISEVDYQSRTILALVAELRLTEGDLAVAREVATERGDEVERLRAAHVELWSCPDCAFTFDAMHTDPGGGYSCPACGELKAVRELHDLQRQRQAVLDLCDELIAERSTAGAGVIANRFRAAVGAATGTKGDPTDGD